MNRGRALCFGGCHEETDKAQGRAEVLNNPATVRGMMAPYAEKGQEALRAAMDGGIDFTEARRWLDDFLEFMKPEAAIAPPGG